MLMQTPIHAAETEISILNATRVQLALCLLLGVFLPFAIYFYPYALDGLGVISARISLIVAVVSTVGGVIILRKMSAFPGASTAGYIVPAFASAYGLAILLVLFARLPHSNAILALCFASTLVVRFLIGAMVRRGPTRTYYIVPGGRVDRIINSLHIDHVMLDGPSVPARKDAIMVADLHYDHSDDWERTLAEAALQGIAVYHYKQVAEALTGRVRIEHLSENSFGSLLPSLAYLKVKRATDLLLCLLVLPFLILPLLIVAVLVKLDSPGPALFRQERLGFRGQPFRVVKFRTMRCEEPKADPADARVAAMTKEQDDRITRLGRFLRRTRIDELPQIVNIIRGEMSWIGPRPEAMALSQWYEREIPFYAYRHIVRPGITGWAQVNQGHVTDLQDVNAKLQYDFFYIKNFSYWIDTLILLRTIMVVFNGFGSK